MSERDGRSYAFVHVRMCEWGCLYCTDACKDLTLIVRELLLVVGSAEVPSGARVREDVDSTPAAASDRPTMVRTEGQGESEI